MAVSKLSLFLAFGLFAMVAGRPMTLDTMGDSTSLASRELLTSSCGSSGCNTSTPGCDLVELSGVCYFSKAMLNYPIMPVTSYYCGLGCPETPYHVQSKGSYNIYVQRTCPAVTCAKTVGQVSAQGSTGCASSSGYINALASGQTKDLYYNVDGHWITTQFQSLCGAPNPANLAAVAGMVAENLASSQALASLIGTEYVCGCCDGHETATQSIAGYTTATARARVQALVQAFTAVFGPGTGTCADSAILDQATPMADALAEDLVSITSEFHNAISLSKFGNKDLYNQVCTYSSVPLVDALKIKYANAYACAIVSALSAAGTSADGSTTSVLSNSCSDNYEIAFSTDWLPGHNTATCRNACKCNFVDRVDGSSVGCPAGIKVCPGGSCEYVSF